MSTGQAYRIETQIIKAGYNYLITQKPFMLYCIEPLLTRTMAVFINCQAVDTGDDTNNKLQVTHMQLRLHKPLINHSNNIEISKSNNQIGYNG